MSDLLELDIWHVRHLVRNHDGVDDGRAVDGQGFAQRGFQFTRLARGNSVTPQARANAAKSGFGNSMASRKGTRPTLSASSVIAAVAKSL